MSFTSDVDATGKAAPASVNAHGGGGPLAGLRVIELAHDLTCFAGKLLGDLGADVIVVEPPGGHPSRSYGPFVGDLPHPNNCLWWWWYNTSKRSVVLDRAAAVGRWYLKRLMVSADVVIEGEAPGVLASFGADYDGCGQTNPRLIWARITPFGSESPRANDPVVDLTLLAGGGAVWSCGYDDHGVPPIRGGGNQSLHIVGLHAALAVLTALVHRNHHDRGQLIDVSAHAATNVTTEGATIHWLVARDTVQRQTGRHAAVAPTLPTQVRAADGTYVQTGSLPPSPTDFGRLLEWLDELGIRDDFSDTPVLELGTQREIRPADIGTDALATEIYRAGREVLHFIASKMPAYDFFTGAQERGLASGVIYSPEEVLTDPHFLARKFPVAIHHPELGRDALYPGPPVDFTKSPMTLRRAPAIGEHSDEILASLLSLDKN